MAATRAQKMEETRAKLIKAARKAFAEKGFAAASMDDLTAEAGLTRGALYHNFGDKKGLLAAVEFVEDKEKRTFFDPSRKIGPAMASALLEQGVIARAMPQGDILGFAPPLCLTREEADIIVGATVKAAEQVFGAA